MIIVIRNLFINGKDRISIQKPLRLRIIEYRVGYEKLSNEKININSLESRIGYLLGCIFYSFYYKILFNLFS